MPFLTQGKTNWKYILILAILGAFLFGSIFYWQWRTGKQELFNENQEPSNAEQSPLVYAAAEQACEQAGGKLCQEYEFCESSTIVLSQTDRCCSVSCATVTQFDFSSQKHCGINPQSGKFNYCYCEPNKDKNKIAVVVKQGSLYDSSLIDSRVLTYFKAVKKDLNIENAGFKKFEGSTIEELDKFIDSLYLNDGAGYVILIGDDLPVADVTVANMSNLHAIYDKLSCVKKDCDSLSCHDVAISYILPPVSYQPDQKAEFISKILETYAGYHNNFETIINNYQKSVLHIQDPEGFTGSPILGYALPVTAVMNTDYQKAETELKNKHFILSIGAHGGSTIVGLGLDNKQYVTLEEYLSFTKENGIPALLVDNGACYGIALKEAGKNYCCWPQIFMESGVWAEYALSGGLETRKIISEDSLGLAVRKTIPYQYFIFGDILAHLK